MKKSLVFLLNFLVLTAFVQAQEEGAKLAKQAGKALTSYNIDPTGNAAKLDEAKAKINQALQLPDAQALSSAWITKGDIYNTFLQRDMVKKQFDPNAQLSGDNDALEAFTGYKKGYELTTKKYEKNDAVKGITEVQGHLINIGVTKYEAGEYEKAFFSFKAALESHDILKANAQKKACWTKRNNTTTRCISPVWRLNWPNALPMPSVITRRCIKREPTNRPSTKVCTTSNRSKAMKPAPIKSWKRAAKNSPTIPACCLPKSITT